MPRTSRRTATFTESLIREMSRVAVKHGAINLSQGFPDFNPPQPLLDAAKAEMDGNNHQYAVTWGAAPLRAALAEKITRTTGQPCDPDTHLVVTCGATEAMMCAVMTVTDVGDRIGLFSPFYENYSADAILSGSTPVFTMAAAIVRWANLLPFIAETPIARKTAWMAGNSMIFSPSRMTTGR